MSKSLNMNEWKTSELKYMQPKLSTVGSKTVNIISSQTNRALQITTPLMHTWGIADYTNDAGEHDGKFNISLNFPNVDYDTPATKDFLIKLKDFEQQILKDAVKHSELWFGEELEMSVVKHNFFPFLKYQKDKTTKKTDLTKPPSIRARVPCYDNRWQVEIYDLNKNLLFPVEDNSNISPMDIVPKRSEVACSLKCSGLWFGGKGWGVTWKLDQCLVKPSELESTNGRCHISVDGLEEETETVFKPVAAPVVVETKEVVKEQPITEVDDSDDDAEAEEEEVVEAPVVKKIVKKIAVPEPEAATTTATEPLKKKIVKKKV